MALKDDANELKGILRDLKDLLKEQNAESLQMKGNFDSSRESMKNLVDVAEEFAKKQKDLSSSEVEALSEKLKKNKEILKLSQSGLLDQISKNKELQKSSKEAEKRALANLKGLKKGSNERKFQLKLLEKAIKSQNTLNRAAGRMEVQYEAAQDAIDDVDGSIEELEGNMKDAFSSKDAKESLGKISKSMDPLKKGFGDIFDGPTAGVMNMLNPLKIVADLIGGLIGNVQEYDKRLGDTAKSMNITYEEADKSNKAMAKFAENASDAAINSENINKAVTDLNKTLGTTVKFEEMSKALQKDVALMGQLEASAGLTGEETQGILKYSLGMGKEAKNVTKQIMAGYKVRGLENKLMLNEKDAMKEISKTSKAVQLSISGGAEGLGKALASAKALGTSLDKVDGIAGSILNFEESIASELEAELLVGKDLNLEKARQAALNGDLATVADEIAKQAGSAAEFTKMNRIQQEAMAKAVGMTREDLAASLMEQEALKNVSAESVDDAYNKLMALDSETEKQAYLNQLGNDSLANQLEQRSIAEEKAESEKKFQDAMVVLALDMGKIKSSFKDIYQTILNTIEKLGGMKTIIAVIGALLAAKVVKGVYNFLDGAGKAIGVVKKLASAQKAEASTSIIGGAWKSLSVIPAVGAGLAAAAATAGIAYLMSQYNAADDMFSPGGSGGGYGNRVLLGPAGAIGLNNKDDVIAGTDLFKKGNDVSSEGGGSTKMGGKGSMSIGSDMSSVVAAITSLGTKVEAMANRPINVGMDGRKVIEAGTGNNPNTFGEEVGKNSFELQ